MDISWNWDYDYLEYAPNKNILLEFLNETQPKLLLKQANYILNTYDDTISFGFVASMALAFDKSRYRYPNPLHSLWARLRAKALEILKNPSFQDPLDYSFFDYKLALSILSVTSLPQDMEICLAIFLDEKYDSTLLKSCIKATIFDLAANISHVSAKIQLQYQIFLCQELQKYPENNERDIRALLHFADVNIWADYLTKLSNGEIQNKKLDDDVLFYLLRTSNPNVLAYTLNLIKAFDLGQEKTHFLYFFYQKATKSDISHLKMIVNLHDKLTQIIQGDFENSDAFFKSDDLDYIHTRLFCPRFYEDIKDEQIILSLLHRLDEYVSNIISSRMFFAYYSFLEHLASTKPDVFRPYQQKKLATLKMLINRKYEAQFFDFDSDGFMKLIKNN
jgi:hypothetical protein